MKENWKLILGPPCRTGEWTQLFGNWGNRETNSVNDRQCGTAFSDGDAHSHTASCPGSYRLRTNLWESALKGCSWKILPSAGSPRRGLCPSSRAHQPSRRRRRLSRRTMTSAKRISSGWRQKWPQQVGVAYPERQGFPSWTDKACWDLFLPRICCKENKYFIPPRKGRTV